MMKLRNVLLIAGTFITLGSLTGCTVFDSFSEVDALNEAQAVGTPFTQALADEYRTYSNSELHEMFDFPDALHFARKGLAAAAGDAVLPEPLSDWNLDTQHMSELGAARGRLMVAFDLGAREQAPALSARVQALFDCWIEQQEEDWESQDIQHCKSGFMKAMNELEAGLQPPAEEIAPMPEEVEVSPFDISADKPMAPENAMYLIFFDWDSHKLGESTFSVLDAVAQEIAKNPPAQVSLVGHADTSGPQTYNQRLAFKRAGSVRDALIERGVNPDLMFLESRGESELLVPTPDNVKEPANRRVNILFK